MKDIFESEVVHPGNDFFNENSGAPFVQPAPAHHRQAVAGNGFADFDPNEDLSQYVANPQPRPPLIQIDENDTTVIGRIYNAAVKLKQLGNSSNLIEKIRIFKELDEAMLLFEKEVEADKEVIKKELGLV